MKLLSLQVILPAKSKLFVSLLCFIFLTSGVYAQTVTGTVSDITGRRLGGVSVNVKGTGVGTSTDSLGQFAITASGTDILTFSSVGFSAIEVPVSGRSSVGDVVLNTDPRNLDVVVVTALDISKEARRLGFRCRKHF